MHLAFLNNMTEQNLKTRVIKTLKYDYPGCWIVKVSDRWIVGLPDICFTYKGITIWMELKAEKGIVSKMQRYVIDKINAAGGHAHVVRSVEEARMICRNLISK